MTLQVGQAQDRGLVLALVQRRWGRPWGGQPLGVTRSHPHGVSESGVRWAWLARGVPQQRVA